MSEMRATAARVECEKNQVSEMSELSVRILKNYEFCVRNVTDAREALEKMECQKCHNCQ